MNQRLLALLSLVGAVGAVGLYTVNQGVTRQDLLAAGAADACSPVVVSCEGQLPDAGYAAHRFRALLCRNDAGTPAGVILPPRLASHLAVFNPASCHRVGAGCTDPNLCTADDGGDAPEADDMPECACSSGSACFVPSDDGGTQAAPLGVTLQPGWSGAGCAPKVCNVVAGPDLSWPGSCPRSP